MTASSSKTLYMCTIMGVRVQQFRKYNGPNIKEFLHLENIHMTNCVSGSKRGNIGNKSKYNYFVIYNLIIFSSLITSIT